MRPFLALALAAMASAIAGTARAEGNGVECPAGARALGSEPPVVESGCLVAGKRHGPYRAYWPGGALWREGRHDDGRRVGVWKGFRPDGTQAYEASYRGGLLDGPLTLIHPNGGKKLEGVYSLGRPNGTFVGYAESGERIGQLVFDAGKVRPRSAGNPDIAALLPSNGRRAASAAARRSLRPAVLTEAGRSLVNLGRAPRPGKLDGERAAQYDAQSAFLEDLGHRVLHVTAALDLLHADQRDGLRGPADDDLDALVGLHEQTVGGAIESSRAFERTSAAASARHAMAATAIRKLEATP